MCNAVYRSVNADIIHEQSRAYRAGHAEFLRMYCKAWRAENPERVLENRRTYNSENADTIRKKHQVWRSNNVEKIQEARLTYYADHINAISAYRQARDKAYPEFSRAAWHRRRARIKANGGNFTAKELTAMRIAQAGICAYCKGQHDPDELTIDHIIPLAQGGRHEAPNICLACPKCNNSKNNRTPEQWVNRWYQRNDNPEER